MSLLTDLLLVMVGGFATWIAYVSWQNRPRAGTAWLSATMSSVSLWAIAHLLEHYASGLLELGLQRAQFAVLSPLAFAWFAFVLTYTGRVDSLNRRSMAVLFTWPAAITLIVWVPGDVLGTLAIWPSIAAEQGPIFWGHVLLSYALLSAGSILLLHYVHTSEGVFRSQGLAVLTGITFAWIGSVISVFELFGPVHLHALPIGFVLMGGCFLWAVVGPGLTRIEPIARRRIIHRLDAGVISVDESCRVMSINPAARRMLDIEDAEVVGEPVAKSFVDLPEVQDFLMSIVREYDSRSENSQANGSSELEIHPNGSGKTDGGSELLRIDDAVIRCHSSPLYDDHNRFRGSVLLMQDVTEQRHRQDRLESQNERLDQFASVVSHDIRNPLTVAMGHLEIERNDHDSEHLETAFDALERMETLIEQLRTLTQSGQAIGEKEQVSLSSISRRCWQMVAGETAELTVEDDISFEADPDRLVQLLENLFGNSVEHAGPDVSVRVGVVEESVDSTDAGTQIQSTVTGFYVADDGPGIPAEDRKQVFESGYSTADDGTGFGLSIVSRIAKAHGWKIGITETAEGGARFEITGIDSISE